jgi:hypothetical protein
MPYRQSTKITTPVQQMYPRSIECKSLPTRPSSYERKTEEESEGKVAKKNQATGTVKKPMMANNGGKMGDSEAGHGACLLAEGQKARCQKYGKNPFFPIVSASAELCSLSTNIFQVSPSAA